MGRRKKDYGYMGEDIYHEGTVIYKLVNTVTGGFYVGRTTSLRRRTMEHLCDLKRGAHGNIDLQKDYDKLGPYVFKVEIIEKLPSDADKDYIIDREVYFINSLNPEYNIVMDRGWNNKLKPVAKVSVINEIVDKYPSISEANLSFGRHPYDKNITSTVTGRQSTAFGFKWVLIKEGMSDDDIITKAEKIKTGVTVVQMINMETGDVEFTGPITELESIYDNSAVHKVLKGYYKHHKGKFFRKL